MYSIVSAQALVNGWGGGGGGVDLTFVGKSKYFPNSHIFWRGVFISLLLLILKLPKSQIPIYLGRGGCWSNFCCWVQNCLNQNFPYFRRLDVDVTIYYLLLSLKIPKSQISIFSEGGGREGSGGGVLWYSNLPLWQEISRYPWIH